MYLIKYKQKFSKRRISLSKSLSLIYGLEFTGFIKLERVWWWRNYIETTKYQEITYPKEGYICVVRLNSTHKHRNTIRVITKQSSSDKRELVVLKKLFGKEKENYERKRNITESRHADTEEEILKRLHTESSG
tara:strand:- start:129 stop:527 length:399 start_codon:yes stop_codon:yes gene_type:complete